MANPLQQYVIPFVGLKIGKHEFAFNVDGKFFQEFEFSEIEEAQIEIRLVLEKKETMLVLEFEINGTVYIMCDRCTGFFHLRVDGANRQYIKFGEPGSSQSEDVTVLSEKSHEVNVSHLIYEFILLLLPARRIHEEGDCDEEMRKQFDNYLFVSDDEIIESEDEEEEVEREIDPRWAALKKLKDND